jgi:cobalt/nickel transport system permease protein
MDIGAIDRSGTQGTSWLHRATPRSKLIAVALVLAAAIVSWNFLVLASLVLVLVAAAISADLDLKLTLTLSLYPAFFAAIFAFAAQPSWLGALVIVLKAVAAAMAVVIIILTTPYPQVFAPLQRIAPGLVGDALLMTYRTFFLLLERFADVVRAIRLRAGIGRSPLRAVRMGAASLGNVLLYSVDLAQREYDVMRLRGYSGRLEINLPTHHWKTAEIGLVSVAAFALALSALWRLGAAGLNPYSWLVPLPALGALAATVLVKRRSA